MSRPWETIAGSLPWESQQALYPRVISIMRPTPPANTGAVGYQGLTRAAETSIATGVAANVTIASSGRNSAATGLPADSAGPIKWTITLPGSAVATLPLIMERDFIYDDLGRRFQVSAYEPSAIGARIDCVRELA